MSKSLYSVILTDEVVREIDRMALMQNTNRSKLINRILAEYVSYTTPEMRIDNIFRTIEEMMNLTDMIPCVLPNQSTMSLKSILEYKYRPTIKYDVELFSSELTAGRLSVIFRTQSQMLLTEMNGFFKLWAYHESALSAKKPEYELFDGRFVRSISIDKNLTANEAADAISAYIKMFDACLKNYITGKFGETDIGRILKEYTERGVLI